MDTVEDDVFRWKVEMTGFDEKSGLGKDFVELRKRYGFSSVELLLTFKRGLHPFYPPRVEILRPRFKGPVAWAITSHPMLRIQNWDPWKLQKEVLMQIKDFLQIHARIDLEQNFRCLYEVNTISSYSNVERHLARLEALSNVLPKWASNPEFKLI